MKIIITRRPDDACIENAWKHVEMQDIEDHAAHILGKIQEGQSIEDDLFTILYLSFRCGFKTAIGHANNRLQTNM